MRFLSRRRRPRPLPAGPPSPLELALQVAAQRGDELLRQALPQLAQDRKQYNRVVAAIIIGGTTAIFGIAWLFGDWVTAQFPAPGLFTR